MRRPITNRKAGEGRTFPTRHHPRFLIPLFPKEQRKQDHRRGVEVGSTLSLHGAGSKNRGVDGEGEEEEEGNEDISCIREVW